MTVTPRGQQEIGSSERWSTRTKTNLRLSQDADFQDVIDRIESRIVGAQDETPGPPAEIPVHVQGEGDRREVEIRGEIPDPILAGYPDERKQDNPVSLFTRELVQAVQDTLGRRLEGVSSGEQVGVVEWVGGPQWRFTRADRFDVDASVEDQFVDAIEEHSITALGKARSVVPHLVEALGAEQARALIERERDSRRRSAGEQMGFGEVVEETGAVEAVERPGEALVQEALARWEEQGIIEVPDDVEGWELVPEEDRTGNYTTTSWKAGTRPLFLRVTAPIGHGSDWGLRLADARIGGFSAVDPHTRTPADRRDYDDQAAAVEAAIRWMASHPADRTEHPFMDEQILDPPAGWRLSSWSVNQRNERIEFTLADEAVLHSLDVQLIEIEGFHRGDTYTVRVNTAQTMNDVDPEGRYPEQGQQVPRARALDAATRFMERHTPTIEDLDETPGSDVFDDDERGRLKHHAERNSLRNILGVLGMRGPGISRTFRGEIDDVNEFVEWFETRGTFQDLEGVGPARDEKLIAAAKIAREERDGVD